MTGSGGERLLASFAVFVEGDGVDADGEAQQVQVLADVANCVCRDRQNSYGDAEDNFQNIADIWNSYLRERLRAPITALDVGWLMVGLKLARASHQPEHLDNAIDAAGYAVCAGGIIKRNLQQRQAPCSASMKEPSPVTQTRSNSPDNGGSD